MKTKQQLKNSIYNQVQQSGFMKNIQAQVKAHVYNIIERDTQMNKNKLGFQYEHPLLHKLNKYPLTALCMDLIQQFLQSFKFKYTLNVFKKQTNREHTMNRKVLSGKIKAISNVQAQAVLLSAVSFLVEGAKAQSGGTQAPNQSRNNHFIHSSENESKINYNGDKDKTNSVSDSYKRAEQTKKISNKNQKEKEKENEAEEEKKRVEAKRQQAKKAEEEQARKKEIESSKKKKEKEKQPEDAKGFLSTTMSKFKGSGGANKEAEQNKLFEAKKAFSEEKTKPKIDPSESGTNVIRGMSAGKPTHNSLLSKFFKQEQKEIQQDIQDSKDERQNPLFSSSESGFGNSAQYDQSVDSNAINTYDYIQKAKNFSKKR